jgi:hypothetical protein
VDYFVDYLKLLVEDRQEYVEWMTMWLADILVNPDDKGNQPVAVVLWGEQGAGKTLLRELMSHLLGARLVHHTDDPLKNGDILAMATTSTRLSSTSCSSNSRRSTSRRTVR